MEDLLRREAWPPGLLCFTHTVTVVVLISDCDIIACHFRCLLVTKQERMQCRDVIRSPGVRDWVKHAHWVSASLEELSIVSSESAFMSIEAHLASSIACLSC